MGGLFSAPKPSAPPPPPPVPTVETDAVNEAAARERRLRALATGRASTDVTRGQVVDGGIAKRTLMGG